VLERVELFNDAICAPIFPARDVREMRGRAQQVQLEINTNLLPPLESAEQNDHAQFGNVRIAAEKRQTQKQANRSNVQPAPLLVRILLAIFAVLTVLLSFASLRVHPGTDWVYHSYDGMPAPCPPPNRGYFPRYCH
jgi:hypothetical protein